MSVGRAAENGHAEDAARGPVVWGEPAPDVLAELARTLVAKGYLVAVAAPIRKYTAREEWVEVIVTAVVPDSVPPRMLPQFTVNANNQAAVLEMARRAPSAAGVALLAPAGLSAPVA